MQTLAIFALLSACAAVSLAVNGVDISTGMLCTGLRWLGSSSERQATGLGLSRAQTGASLCRFARTLPQLLLTVSLSLWLSRVQCSLVKCVVGRFLSSLCTQSIAQPLTGWLSGLSSITHTPTTHTHTHNHRITTTAVSESDWACLKANGRSFGVPRCYESVGQPDSNW